MTLNVGIIGAGRIGKVHAETLTRRIPGVRVLAIADVVEAAARDAAAQYGIPEATADYQAVLGNADIDIVVICSSTDTHSQFITEASQAGKQIFCEKPLDFDLGRIDAALAAVAQAGVKLQIGFNRRFDPNHARVRQAVVQGEIGTPHLLHIISRDPAPPPLAYIKVSGGIFLDMTIHDFDMARFLIGSEVEEIYTAAGVMVDPAIGEAGDVDTAMITLKFANGVIGVIDNSRQAVYGYDQRVEVFGSKGSASTGNWYPNAVTISTDRAVQRDLPLNFFMDRYTESYVAEMVTFIDAVQNDKPSPVSGAEGRVPVVMGLAARRSLAENRPVRLDEIAL
jgi:myo-inositol 2-dehydrogenase / D-chiro-inositol 1-dehydrogenase